MINAPVTTTSDTPQRLLDGLNSFQKEAV